MRMARTRLTPSLPRMKRDSVVKPLGGKHGARLFFSAHQNFVHKKSVLATQYQERRIGLILGQRVIFAASSDYCAGAALTSFVALSITHFLPAGGRGML